MKRRFTILTAALALLTFLAVPMGMWGQETVTATSTTMTANVSYQDLETGKLIEYKNSASNSYSNPLRIYSGNTFTIHAKEGVEKITQIAIVANSTSYANATKNATWTATGEGSCSATASVSGSNVTVAITGTATTVTCKPSEQIRWNQLSVTYVTSGTPPAITYTMTYDANGGIGTMTDEDSPYDANATVTVLDNEFTREHFDFVKWNTKADGTGTDYDEGDTFTIRDNTTLYAQWESDGTAGEGSICFSNQSSCTAINSTSVTGDDNLDNTWTITTQGTNSFTANSTYYQVGSGSKPATSITFTTTLAEEVNITDFSASFGGFGATAGTITLKVGNTTVGTGSLNAANDVTVSNTIAKEGTTLTVIVNPTAGGVKCYNISYAYETIDNPAVATTTTINVPQNFNTDIYQGTTAGTLTATVKDNDDNTVSGATVTWSSSNTGVATIDANGAVTLVAVGTTTITANYAGVEDEYRPSEGTYELTVTDSNAPGTQNNPYTVAQARAAIDAGTGTQGVYATGIVCTASSNLYQNKYLSYYISADGSTESDQLEAYNGLGIDGASFASVDDVQVGDVVVIYGNLTKYNSTYEFAVNNQLVSLVRPNKYTLTATMSHVADFTIFAGDEIISGPDPENPSQTVQVSAGTTVGVSIGGMENCYLFSSLTVNGSTAGVTQDDPDDLYFEFTMPDGDAEIDVTTTTATPFTLTVVGMDNVSFDMYMGYNSTEVTITEGTASICEQMHVIIDDLTVSTGFVLDAITLSYGNTTEEVNPALGFTMPSSDAMLTFTTHEAETFTYTKVTSVTPGKHYIIVTSSTDSNGKYHAMGGKNSGSSYMDPIVVSVDNNTVTVAENEGVAEILIGGTIDNYTLHTSEGYLVGGNKLMNTNGSEESTWTISFNENNQAIITWTINTTGYSIQYNSSNPRFACYSSSQAKVCLYEKDEPATETHTLTVTGYADYSAKDGYCLIASPVTVDPADVEGLVVANTDLNYDYFDLYSFANNQDKEWCNYKDTHFDLIPGTGYLYAKKATTEGETFSFELTGTPYSGNGEIELTQGTGNWADWNLVGNPYGVDAEISMDYYEMNGDGSGLMAGVDEVVDAMQGVFVEYTENDQTVNFVPQRGANPGVGNKLVLNLVRNRGTVIDRAIVRLGEGRQMTKFTLFENSTKLYIPQDDEDYAIVRSEAQGELPVNFRASENGTYTLSMNVENVDMNYLHLIDNMTGMDVDLLQTPSYTFEANTNDYANRFKLVFASNGTNEADESSFAFFSNGNLIVNNEGNATLQVIDINGRILSSETISGSCSKAINATTGVYMLRLINGENVKVQKVVVR